MLLRHLAHPGGQSLIFGGLPRLSPSRQHPTGRINNLQLHIGKKVHIHLSCIITPAHGAKRSHIGNLVPGVVHVQIGLLVTVLVRIYSGKLVLEALNTLLGILVP